MNFSMKFDDSEFYNLNFETELPNEAGAIPLGFYFSWAMANDLLSADQQTAAMKLNAKPSSCADLVLDLCDGKLCASDFNEQGLAFTENYYQQNYIADYVMCFSIDNPSTDALCSIPDSNENLLRISALVNERYRTWQAERPAQSRPKKARKPTPASVLGDLKTLLLPALLLDGFIEKPTYTSDLIVTRTHGQVQQMLWLMNPTVSNGSIHVSIFIRFGCVKLRELWLSLLEPQYRQEPPVLFSSEFDRYPDLQSSDLDIIDERNLVRTYLERFASHPQVWAKTIAGIYQDHLRDVLNTAVDAAALARLAQTWRQLNRKKNDWGRIRSTELLARIALLGTYSDRFRNFQAHVTRAELLRQFDEDIHKDKDFPLRTDIERLLDTVAGSEFADKAKAFLQR
jgi:hypothetical protein